MRGCSSVPPGLGRYPGGRPRAAGEFRDRSGHLERSRCRPCGDGDRDPGIGERTRSSRPRGGGGVPKEFVVNAASSLKGPYAAAQPPDRSRTSHDRLTSEETLTSSNDGSRPPPPMSSSARHGTYHATQQQLAALLFLRERGAVIFMPQRVPPVFTESIDDLQDQPCHHRRFLQ
jgi:hypothetical protein